MRSFRHGAEILVQPHTGRVPPGGDRLGGRGRAIAAWPHMGADAAGAPGSVLPSRFGIVTPPAQPLNVSSQDRDLALSPDGRHLADRFGGTTTGGGPSMARTIDRLHARPIAACRRLRTFLSPESRRIGFFE